MSEEILKALTIIEEEENRTEKDIEIIRQAKQEIERLHSIIKEVREFINHYETIRGYYEYEELGYDEYNYDKNIKRDILESIGE